MKDHTRVRLNRALLPSTWLEHCAYKSHADPAYIWAYFVGRHSHSNFSGFVFQGGDAIRTLSEQKCHQKWPELMTIWLYASLLNYKPLRVKRGSRPWTIWTQWSWMLEEWPGLALWSELEGQNPRWKLGIWLTSAPQWLDVHWHLCSIIITT